MELYVDSQFCSPYALAAFVALREKGLAFTLVPLDLADRSRDPPGYAALSLTGRVPTLVDGEFALSESSAITEYVDDVAPGIALYPRAPQQRARARQVQAWLRSDLLPLRQDRSTEVVFYGVHGAPLTAAGHAAARKLVAAASLLLPAGAANLFGAWSIADVDLALMLNRLAHDGDVLPARLRAYAASHWQRPSVQAWLAQPRPAL